MSKLTAVDDAYVDDTVTFASLGLDPRISEAVVQLGFKNPTLIQSKAIPLALEEKCDIIAKASTGSGKTAAYLIPIIQSILDEYAAEGIISNNDGSHKFKAVILVPTKELSNQVASFCKLLLKNCGNLISLLNLADSYTPDVLKALIASKPEILITTPNKFLKLIENDDSLVDLSELQQTLRFICLDEVDLIFSYGYQEDLDKIVELLNISKLNIQSFSMSATLNDEITSTIKTNFCKTPKVLKLNDDEVTKNKDKLIQYYIKTSEFDKFLMTFVILKLNLIKGKILVFVNNIERGYRLKLFLEQFGIKGCILNSELPINSRLHIIDQYNKNYYNLLIATDDSHGLEIDEGDIQETKEEEEQQQQEDHESQPEQKQKDEEEEEQHQQQQQIETVPQPNATKQNTKQNSKKKRDNEFGVSRGVDFKNVACVLNFDLPTTSKNYVHRIGRTARANKSGIALSYVVDSKYWGKHKQSSLLTAKKDEKIFERILNKQKKIGLDVIPYKFNSSHLESFRYRVEDAFRAVTGTAIREARIREIKQEILTSEKLKRHFEENPQDLEALRHDKELHAARAQPHLKNIPNYLLPDSLKKDAKSIGFVPLNKPNRKRQRGGKNGKKGGSGKKRKSNPLKTFRAK